MLRALTREELVEECERLRKMLNAERRAVTELQSRLAVFLSVNTLPLTKEQAEALTMRAI